MTPKQQREFDHSVKLAIHEHREEKLFSLEDVAEAVSHVNHEFALIKDNYFGEIEINERVVDSVETFLMTKHMATR